MERGSDLPDGKRRPGVPHGSAARSWEESIRRGAIIGCVLGGHFMILMLVLHPWWRRTALPTRNPEDAPLRISFDPLHKPVRPPETATARRLPARTKAARHVHSWPLRPSAMSVSSTSPRAAPLTTLPPPTSSMDVDAHRNYQPGDFQSKLQDAQRTRADHLPGSATEVIGGMRFQARSNLKAVMRGLIEANRCTNMQFQLQDSTHQLTPAMIDRALELDGCGPHLDKTPNSTMVDAISRQLTGH